MPRLARPGKIGDVWGTGRTKGCRALGPGEAALARNPVWNSGTRLPARPPHATSGGPASTTAWATRESGRSSMRKLVVGAALLAATLLPVGAPAAQAQYPYPSGYGYGYG